MFWIPVRIDYYEKDMSKGAKVMLGEIYGYFTLFVTMKYDTIWRFRVVQSYSFSLALNSRDLLISRTLLRRIRTALNSRK
jgi:hypothetical protein